MIVYLDAVWLLNFLLDTMLLMLTQLLAKDSTRKSRIIFGGFIASAIVPVSVYYPDSFFLTVIGKILYSIGIIGCTFRFYSVRRMLKMLLLFYFTTFTIGGGLIALHFLFQNSIQLSPNGILTIHQGFGDPISWLFVVLGFPIVWGFTKSRMDKHAIEKIKYDQLYPVTIQINKTMHSTTGYIDSGNQLVDSITRKPVIVCDESFLMKWFQEKDWQTIKMAFETLDFEKIPESWQKKIHIVPFQGVAGKREFMPAIKPDQLIIYYDGNKIMTNKVLIGIQFAELTSDGSYHCLLHPQIIKLSAANSA